MSAKRTSILLGVGILWLSGCAINQHVESYTVPADTELCIIENPKTRQGFLDAYRSTLDLMGIRSMLLPEGSSIRDCWLVSTYIGRWSWDLAIYLSLAEIKVYADGELAGTALYDSRSGPGRLDKYQNAEEKIQELVRELFVVSRSAGNGVSPTRQKLQGAGSQYRSKPQAQSQSQSKSQPAPAKPGKHSYTVENLPEVRECNRYPVARVTAQGAGVENYSVDCTNGDLLAVRCESTGVCRVLKW